MRSFLPLDFSVSRHLSKHLKKRKKITCFSNDHIYQYTYSGHSTYVTCKEMLLIFEMVNKLISSI